jgi:histidinol phosphatase-like enzyme (inositol monophosphatase family)
MNACAELSRIVGATALQYYRSNVEVETKADGSPVTIADRAAEQAAREWLGRNFPDDGVLGEEFGDTRPDAKRRWIIDPIDGTKSFVRGVPLWGSLVAVTEGETVLAGSAFFPAVAEHLAAGIGCGCWWNGKRCSVSATAELAEATVLTTESGFRGDSHRLAGWGELASKAAVARTLGDCYGYLLVATGRAEAMLDDQMNPWDAAALLPIITEAGGVFTDWNGKATAFGKDAIATNAALDKTVRNVLGIPRTPGEPGNV